LQKGKVSTASESGNEDDYLEWDDLERYAFGYLGMSKKQFLKSTPREFTNRLSGFVQLENQRYYQQMDMNRMLMFTIVKPHLKKELQHKTLYDLYPFPWDELEEKTSSFSEEEKKQSAASFWDKIDNQVAKKD